LVKGNITAGYAGSTRAAISLDNITINHNLLFAQQFQINTATQCAGNKALNFLRTAGLAFFSFTLHTFMC
jgi:hypothetical protein